MERKGELTLHSKGVYLDIIRHPIWLNKQYINLLWGLPRPGVRVAEDKVLILGDEISHLSNPTPNETTQGAETLGHTCFQLTMRVVLKPTS